MDVELAHAQDEVINSLQARAAYRVFLSADGRRAPALCAQQNPLLFPPFPTTRARGHSRGIWSTTIHSGPFSFSWQGRSSGHLSPDFQKCFYIPPTLAICPSISLSNYFDPTVVVVATLGYVAGRQGKVPAGNQHAGE